MSVGSISRDSVARAEPIYAGHRQDDCVEFARVTFFRRVSTLPRKSSNFEIRAVMPELRLAAQAARADARPGGRSLQAAPACEIRQSRGSSRLVIAGNARPPGISVGTSFML